MNITDLHKITGELIAQGHGAVEVAMDINTFMEGPEGENIASVDNAGIQTVECKEPDSEESFEDDIFVLRGGA